MFWTYGPKQKGETDRQMALFPSLYGGRRTLPADLSSSCVEDILGHTLTCYTEGRIIRGSFDK